MFSIEISSGFEDKPPVETGLDNLIQVPDGPAPGSGVVPLVDTRPGQAPEMLPVGPPEMDPGSIIGTDGGIPMVEPGVSGGVFPAPAEYPGGFSSGPTQPLESQADSTSGRPVWGSVKDLDPGAATLNPGNFFKNQIGFPSAGTPGGRPSGFMGNSMGLPMVDGIMGDIPGRLNLSTSLSGTYSTNPSQGYSTTGNAGKSDFFMTLGGGLGYSSQLAHWGYGVTYSGGYNEYFSQSELSGYNQSAGATANYDAGPFTAAVNLGIGYGSGANRYYAAVVNELSVNYGLNASYRISPKTSLSANFSQSLSNASGAAGSRGASDTGSFESGLVASWRYSALLSFGPGIRYSYTAGEVGQSRTSIGPTVNATYKLSSKVSLNSQIGLNFARYESGESADPSLSTSIALDYKASRLWGMNLSLYRDVQANPAAAGQFSEVTSLRVGCNRRIRRANWNMGVSYETRGSQAPAGAGATGPDHDYFTFDTSLGMPVFANTCSASVFFSYSEQGGAVSGGQTDSSSVGFSISRSF